MNKGCSHDKITRESDNQSTRDTKHNSVNKYQVTSTDTGRTMCSGRQCTATSSLIEAREVNDPLARGEDEGLQGTQPPSQSRDNHANSCTLTTIHDTID